MQRTVLQASLAEETDAFCRMAAPMTEVGFANQPNGRWSVGDTGQHLYLSAKPVLRLLAGPRDVFTQWGYAEGPSRSYDDMNELYSQVLTKGIKAPDAFSPRPDDVPLDKVALLTRFTDTYLTIANQLTGWSDEELDRYQMPHPALGLISVREMLYFIGIHTRHHIAVPAAY